jgi:hypothetical protein
MPHGFEPKIDVILVPVLWINTGFNADPDPEIQPFKHSCLYGIQQLSGTGDEETVLHSGSCSNDIPTVGDEEHVLSYALFWQPLQLLLHSCYDLSAVMIPLHSEMQSMIYRMHSSGSCSYTAVMSHLSPCCQRFKARSSVCDSSGSCSICPYHSCFDSPAVMTPLLSEMQRMIHRNFQAAAPSVPNRVVCDVPTVLHQLLLHSCQDSPAVMMSL